MVRFGRSRSRTVVPLVGHGANGRRDTQLGSLARALLGVEQAGIAVPDGFVVTADVFRQVVHDALPPGHEPSSLLRTVRRSSGVERAARARERLLDVTMDNDVEREIDQAFAELLDVSPWGIAVRSSPVLFDQGFSRTVGLAFTELPIKTRDELGRVIRRIWASAASEATLELLRRYKIRDVAIAVLLQPVIAARATVTLVTDTAFAGGASIASGKAERLAIAVRGIEHSLVDFGAAEIVTFDEKGDLLARRPPSQEVELAVRDGSLASTESAGAERILSAIDIERLAGVAERLASLGPSVIRCILPADGEPYVVDRAPLEHAGHSGQTTSSLWVRTGVDATPAGPLTPLSAHLMREPLLERGRLAYGEHAPREARLAEMLASVSGRPYLNLSPLLERQGPTDLVEHVELGSGQWTRELSQPSAVRLSLARSSLRIAQLASEQKALGDDVTRFEREAEQQRRWLAELDLGILPDDALTTTLHEVSAFLSRAHRLHARAHALSVGGHAVLSSVVAGVDAPRAPWLSHAVSAGAGVLTARPAAAFCHVAAIARFDPAASGLVERGEVDSPTALPEGPLARALRQFLEAYGDRGPFETELSSPRWGESAVPIFAMLRAASRGDPVDPDVAASRARSLANRALALLEPGLSFFETRVVRDIVSRTRELLRLRERCRARIAHGLAMMRVVMLDVDRRLRRLDPTLPAGAAAFLTLKELGVAVSKNRADLAPIVRARQSDLFAQRLMREPSPVFRGAPKAAYPLPPFAALSGLSLAGGAGEGRVVRLGPSLEGLSRFAPGDVLCLSTLDLGLTPLFLFASAVVTELGTPFSSSAVVARDAGVPMVGAVAATALLRDGDRVKVDGDAGTVEVQAS